MSLIFFFFLLLSLTFAMLTLVAELVESHLSSCYLFFLSSLALSKGLEFWVEAGTEALALNLSS